MCVCVYSYRHVYIALLEFSRHDAGRAPRTTRGYVCVCVCVYRCVFLCACTYLCVHTCIYRYRYTYTCTYTHIHVHLYTQVERLERHFRALVHRTLSRARRLAQQYQAQPPLPLLLLDLACILASIGAAIFLLRAHASILPLAQMCEGNVTIGAPPCSRAATGGSAGVAGSAASAYI